MEYVLFKDEDVRFKSLRASPASRRNAWWIPTFTWFSDRWASYCLLKRRGDERKIWTNIEEGERWFTEENIPRTPRRTEERKGSMKLLPYLSHYRREGRDPGR
ncbi:hypothetical protein NPIL_282591 [Nephila pilipes]|uniref:Uncharacterized protein n=1 Tax=Nephila pilipes TaxID=299642 RepID=A0A8X6U2Z8_NEPPI|nr:hypothetical protein NPIL_282591 [Nephila pilipes]